MAEQQIQLSDGSFLTLPDDMPDDQVTVQVNNAEQQLKAQPADDGRSPVPVDPRWGDDSTLKGKIYNYGHEALTGVAEGVAEFGGAVGGDRGAQRGGVVGAGAFEAFQDLFFGDRQVRGDVGDGRGAAEAVGEGAVGLGDRQA